MKDIECLEMQFELERELKVYDEHRSQVIENRFRRAIHEGIQILLTKEEFMEVPSKEREDWAMIPMEPPWFWARGPISGPIISGK